MCANMRLVAFDSLMIYVTFIKWDSVGFSKHQLKKSTFSHLSYILSILVKNALGILGLFIDRKMKIFIISLDRSMPLW